jgi:Kef-type K+ transport system membrane component KefB
MIISILLMLLNLFTAFVAGLLFSESRHLHKTTKVLRQLKDEIGKEGWNPDVADAQ